MPGSIENPVMICPVCEKEYRATGMTWIGSISVAGLTDTQLNELAEELCARMLEINAKDELPS